MGRSRTTTGILAAAVAAVAGLAPGPGAAAAQEGASARAGAGPGGTAVPPASVVYLVRHAETADDDPRDPTLSDAGEARARRLARVLADAGIDRIHSTPFRRTLGTARPVAEAVGLGIERYDPREPASRRALLAALRSGGRHLVVGHSNTTPDLVRALGGEPGEPIREDEHDRLYVVHLTGGTATTVLLRFGEPSRPAAAEGHAASADDGAAGRRSGRPPGWAGGLTRRRR